MPVFYKEFWFQESRGGLALLLNGTENSVNLTEFRLSKKPLCIVAKWLLAVGESRNTIKVATCGGRVS